MSTHTDVHTHTHRSLANTHTVKYVLTNRLIIYAHTHTHTHTHIHTHSHTYKCISVMTHIMTELSKLPVLSKLPIACVAPRGAEETGDMDFSI